MQGLDEFRLFYNHTIHPELLRMEQKRRRLFLLLFVSFFVILAAVIFGLYLQVMVFTLMLMIPVGFYITYLIYRIQEFRITFKPRVVNLVLDFIDNGISYGALQYDAKRSIPKKTFLASRIFATRAPTYIGEDYIYGKIGELDFEMCELKVREFSKVRTRLNYVFKGVFLHTTFNRPQKGSIVIWPREFRQYLSGSIKAFSRNGAREVAEDVHHKSFSKFFMAYATKDANTASLLSREMQALIANYREKSNKEVYFSFINRDIYIGITEPKDILEPYIFRSNVSFELVREFFEDLQLLMSIVEDFDKSH